MVRDARGMCGISDMQVRTPIQHGAVMTRDTHAIHTDDTHRADTHGPMVALCRMDANGKLTWAGDRTAIHTMQAAIAERYFAIEAADRG